MTTAAAAQAFVDKWARVTVNEKAAAQEHFIDLCRLLGQPTPNEADPTGQFYRFEQPLTKAGGGAGFADVWRRDHFAWEYKSRGKYATLREAYQQLLLYKEALDNPPVLVACDIARYEVHIAFTGHKTRVETFTNADLATVSTRDLLRLVFTDPEQLRPVERVQSITEKIASDFAQVAQWVERRGYEPQRVARFFMKLLFAMFAEDIGLVPNKLLSQSLKEAIFNPAEFNEMIQPLFRVMRDGGYWGPGNRIPHFNGGLFEDDDAIPLKPDDLQYLYDAARQDWRDVEPVIFGTLFERSLDPAKRAQLGAHYTSRDDILLLVEPVLIAPLRAEWERTRTEIEALRPQWEAATGATKQRQRNGIEGLIFQFLERLANTKVLDAACGSGNFLYVALNELKNLEKEVIQYAVGLGLEQPEQGVGPQQLLGIEMNPFAAELAQVVVWIGDLQWNSKNGFWKVADPVLSPLRTIQCDDALITYDIETGQPKEQQWPAADVILGNPPFLGGSKLRRELGDEYIEMLWKVYAGRVPSGADLVTYWFEKARAQIETGKTDRAGLIATNSIRGGANRKVLDRIKQTGDIFYAHADRPWILEGAAVRVSMVGFDGGATGTGAQLCAPTVRMLDGHPVEGINADLTGTINLTSAKPLKENEGICFRTDEKGGPFDIDAQTAQEILSASINSHGRPNSDVVRPYVNGLDVTRRPQNMWVIDFGHNMTEQEASQYAMPFDYVQRVVKPVRDQVRNERERTYWWLHRRPAPDMRRAVTRLRRFIATPSVAKHRLFVWLDSKTIPDHQLYIFAREDDYFFGVLHSRAHELWALRMGSWLGKGNDPRYTPTTTFETFPFPWPPGQEPQDDPRVGAIAQAARRLVELRDAWLNPPGVGASKDRTLTNLYNRRPDWLDQAHRALDAAVLAAYGWPADLSDDDLLARLLALNAARAAGAGATE